MTIEINVDSDRVLELDEFKALYREGRFDASDCHSLAEAAPLLRGLSNNKRFLGDIILDELSKDLAGQGRNGYGPHVVILGDAGDFAMMRANLWPSAKDDEYIRRPEAFIYGVPHDHNFNFMTIGYWVQGIRVTILNTSMKMSRAIPVNRRDWCGHRPDVYHRKRLWFIGRTGMFTHNCRLMRCP